MKKYAAVTVSGVVLLAASVCLAGDWPNFRGPNWDGKSRETGLLASWPEQGPPLAWKVEGLGKGFSSVAIVGGKIFTMGDRTVGEGDNEQYLQFVICLDKGTRKELWAARVGEA